jgi:DHA2 family multidrug resistance protein
MAASLGAGALFVLRTRRAREPIVDLRALADRDFALGCALSFILGVGLYGSIYLMPVFLAFVRNHSAFEIGQTMMVTGAAQLLMAPLAVAFERRARARVLTALGFGVFALGLALSAFQTRATDFDEMLVPQIVRGAAIMFCLLPPIRLALGHLAPAAVANASGLFNLLRNLGGAIGLALIDTLLYGRTPEIAERLAAALAQGDAAAAQRIGLPLDRFLAHVPGAPLEPHILSYVQAAVRRQATVEAINEAWLMVAVVTLAGTLAVLLCRPVRS